MTQQLDAAIRQSAEARVQAWLVDFESALAARDIDRVVAKFVPESIWRDLVAFTWNIKTVEGREGIADMLRARLADTDPLGFRTRETPTDDGGGVHRRLSNSKRRSAEVSVICGLKAISVGRC
jgi:putative flavoprotein involved in K+ transport